MVEKFPRFLEGPARAAQHASFRFAGRVGPALAKLPGDSTRFGPPRNFTFSLPEWAESHPEVTVRQIDPVRAQEVSRPAQPSSDPLPELFGRLDRTTFPTWVATVPGGRLVGEDAIVVAPDDTVFAELHNSWPKTLDRQKLTLRLKLPPVQHLSGRVAVAGAAWANNYCHFLIDVMPRLRLLGDELQKVDHLVVHHGARFQRELLEAAGAPMDRLIEPTPDMHLLIDELVVPSLVPRCTPEHNLYVQGLFDGHRSTARPSRRLYLTRANMWRRNIENERELLDVLEPRGFETVVMDGLSVADQARLFSEAEIVLGPDGGALTNMLFAQPGAIMMEIFDENYVQPSFWEITDTVGGTFHALIGRSPTTSSQWREIVAPIADVVAALDARSIT